MNEWCLTTHQHQKGYQAILITFGCQQGTAGRGNTLEAGLFKKQKAQVILSKYQKPTNMYMDAHIFDKNGKRVERNYEGQQKQQ